MIIISKLVDKDPGNEVFYFLQITIPTTSHPLRKTVNFGMD